MHTAMIGDHHRAARRPDERNLTRAGANFGMEGGRVVEGGVLAAESSASAVGRGASCGCFPSWLIGKAKGKGKDNATGLRCTPAPSLWHVSVYVVHYIVCSSPSVARSGCIQYAHA